MAGMIFIDLEKTDITGASEIRTAGCVFFAQQTAVMISRKPVRTI